MMCATQIFLRCDAHELGFNFSRGFAAGEAGAVGDAKDVRIHGDRAFAEDFHQHDVCGLAPDARERLQRVALARHFAIVLIDQSLRERDDVFGFVAPEPDRFDVIRDPLFAELQHLRRRIRDLKQWPSRAVDAFVGRLRR